MQSNYCGSQAQQMVMDTLGLALCVTLTYAVRHNPRGRMLLPICAFPALAAVDLFCIFQELKATHLRTLNRERAEMVAERWLADGTIFSASQVRFPSCSPMLQIAENRISNAAGYCKRQRHVHPGW